LTNLNAIVKAAIEKCGSEATKTAVRVSSVKIILKEGTGAINGLTVANPKDFDTRHAFSLGEISTKFNIKSLTDDVKVIDEIIIHAPKVQVEINEDNTINLNELKKNISSSAPGTSTNKQENGNATRLIIRYLRFSNGHILAKVVPLNNKEYQLKLPSFVLKNLGGKKGATPSQIANQILKELTNRALAQIKKKGINQGIGKIKSEVKSKLKTEKDKAVDKLKELFGK